MTFDVVAGPDDAVRFKVRDRLYAPEEVSALVLRKLVEDASKLPRAPGPLRRTSRLDRDHRTRQIHLPDGPGGHR
nr:hypothetical protein [Micromonospora chalcea]